MIRKKSEKVKIIIDEVVKVSSSDLIAGEPAPIVIKFLRLLSNNELSTNEALEISDINLKITEVFLNRLDSEEGLIQSDSNLWSLTQKGALYAAARLAKIKRTTGKDIVQALPVIAERINDEESLAYRVDRLAVFGSYLSEKEQIGDLDLATEIVPRLADVKEQFKLLNSRAEKAGNVTTNPIHKAMFAQNEVFRMLKANRKSLSLHSYDDLYAIGCPFQTIYVSPWLIETALTLGRFFESKIKPELVRRKSKRVKLEDLITLGVEMISDFARTIPNLQQYGMLRAVGHQLTDQAWEYHNPQLGYLAVIAAAESEPGFLLNEHLIELIEKQHAKSLRRWT